VQIRPRNVAALRSGVRIEQLTIAWMMIEGAVALAAGIVTGSILLTAFGIDSVIELVSGSVLLWRLRTQVRDSGAQAVETAERRAAWITGIALALLCVYIVVTSVASLAFIPRPERSLVGIIVAVAAVIAMPLFAWRKRDISQRIESSALRVDASCSMTCAYMAATLLVGLTLNDWMGWWCAEPIAGLAFLIWLVPETVEAVNNAREGRSACSCS
jgi:divalent metal cation (Fe/Co/Zn/Cd) transporter